MFYFASLLMMLLFFLPLHADDFERLNPRLTKEMKESQSNAKLCETPAVAEEKFGDSFHYGCFCGKGYPVISHPSKKHYTKLNRTEREELISQYYEIEPYDSIDEVCMKHDICYISSGGADRLCNDAIYTTLRDIGDAFYDIGDDKENNKKERQCRTLAFDIGSVFKPIFVSENRTIIDYGVQVMTTPIIVGSKSMKKVMHTMNSTSTYPLEGEKCLLEELNISKENK